MADAVLNRHGSGQGRNARGDPGRLLKPTGGDRDLLFEEIVVEHELAVGSMGGPAMQLYRLNLAQLVQQRSGDFSCYGWASGALLCFVAAGGFDVKHQAFGGSD